MLVTSSSLRKPTRQVSLRGIVTFIVVVFANGVGAARYFKHLAPSLSASETGGRDIPATTEGEGWEDCEVPMDALLLDYMLSQCCPPPGSGLSLSDEQQSAVYHEGPGGYANPRAVANLFTCKAKSSC